jgi:hypothetical protein
MPVTPVGYHPSVQYFRVPVGPVFPRRSVFPVGPASNRGLSLNLKSTLYLYYKEDTGFNNNIVYYIIIVHNK